MKEMQKVKDAFSALSKCFSAFISKMKWEMKSVASHPRGDYPKRPKKGRGTTFRK